MSATKHARELGCTIRCNWPGCTATHTTALVSIKANRTWAQRKNGGGWIRGTLKRSTGNPKTGTGELANGRWDICPAHAPLERAKAKAREAASKARQAERDAKRKARDKVIRQATEAR